MTELATIRPIGAMRAEQIAQVQALEAALLDLPQVEVQTQHVFHAGLYGRTITMPPGAVLTGALIKRSTLLIVAGHCHMFGADGARILQGYHVLPASAGRKQAFHAIEATSMTMLFATDATTVEEAEREFTDEFDKLLSHQQRNDTTITGE